MQRYKPRASVDPIGNDPDQFFIGVDPCAGELVRSDTSACASQHSRNPLGHVLNIDETGCSFVSPRPNIG